MPVPVYDGRNRQLKVPEELRNIPAILSRYPGEIPYHSLVLVAYTVSFYRATQGSRKDQPTIPLNLSFAVVLHDKPLEFEGSDGGEDEQESDTVEEDGYKDAKNQRNETPQDLRANEAVNESGEEVDDQSDLKVED